MAEKKDTKKTMDFEKSLDRLETIVSEMEGGSLSLKKMMDHFEEGQKLVAFCSKKLDEVERKIEVLVKKGDGVATEPFAGADDADAEPTGEELF